MIDIHGLVTDMLVVADMLGILETYSCQEDNCSSFVGSVTSESQSSCDEVA